MNFGDEVWVSLSNSILLLGIVQAFVVAGFLVFTKGGNRRANLFLAALLAAVGLTLLNDFFAHTGFYSRHQHLYFIPIYYNFWFGPLLYYHVKARASVKEQALSQRKIKHELSDSEREKPDREPVKQRSRLEMLHWVLPGLQAVFFFVIGFRGAEYKSMIWEELIGPWLGDTMDLIFLLSMIFYLTLSFRLLKARRQSIFPSTYRCTRRFLRAFTLAIALVSIYNITDFIAWKFFQTNLYNVAGYSYPGDLLNSFLVYWVGFNGFIQARRSAVPLAYPVYVPAAGPPPQAPRQPAPDEKQGQKKKPLSDGEMQRILTDLKRIFESEKLFLDPELNLRKVAAAIETNEKLISYSINHSLGMSYNEWVNKYRVEEVIRRFSDPAYNHYAILSIALDSGFNSKATFNRAFKEVTQQTPSAYRKSLSA